MTTRVSTRRNRRRAAHSLRSPRQHFSPEYINKIKTGNVAILHYQEIMKKRHHAAR